MHEFVPARTRRACRASGEKALRGWSDLKGVRFVDWLKLLRSGSVKELLIGRNQVSRSRSGLGEFLGDCLKVAYRATQFCRRGCGDPKHLGEGPGHL